MSEDWGRTLEDTRALRTDAGGELVRRRCVVRVADGASAGKEAVLERASLIVGSASSADLAIDDPRVSRLHAELTLAAEGVRVRDLGSRNGTFAGEARVSAIVVPIGTRIRVGRTTLELRGEDERVSVAPSLRTRFGGLIGSSAPMRRLFAILEQVAHLDVPVLLYGESGAGKTTAAIALHAESGRAGQARAIDVSAAPPSAAELAEPGTLILEHVDRASASTASSIVSALEAREHGGTAARIVSTAREDPRALVETGAFSRDLYFHLANVRALIPPLRDHADDVPLLVEAFLPPGASVPHEALDELREDGYPGNVRSLRGALEASIATRPSEPEPLLPFREAKQEVVDRFERQYLARLLEEHDGNVSQAARAAGVARSHFITLLAKHGLG